MRIAHLSKYHLAAVIWEDAHHSLEEYTAEDVERNFHKPILTTNYGLLIKQDEQGVTLTSEEDVDGDLRHVFFIPSKMIIEVVDFGQPKRKAGKPSPPFEPADPVKLRKPTTIAEAKALGLID